MSLRVAHRPRVSESSVSRIFRKERRHKGDFVAIDAETGEYFISQTAIDALLKARAKYPGRAFVLRRIGFAWTFRLPDIRRLGKRGR